MSTRWPPFPACALLAALLCPTPVVADIAPRPDQVRDAKDPVVEKQKVATHVRAVVHHEEVVVCLAGGDATGGADCPTELATVVGVIPATEGPLQLPKAIARIRSMSAAHPDDPCGENRVVEGAAWEKRDLGGDGVLEIVVTARGYESYTTFVYRLDGAKVESLGNSGCAI